MLISYEIIPLCQNPISVVVRGLLAFTEDLVENVKWPCISKFRKNGELFYLLGMYLS